MVIEAFIQACQNFGDLWFLLAICAGTIIGLIFGLLVGVGALLATSLILPFIFGIQPEYALALMVAASAVTYTGGSITAILLNVPGTEASAATLLDGFPMTQHGEAGRALGAALVSSGLGGLVTPFIALATIPLILPIVFAVRSADMVFIILLGISFIAILGRGSMIKGVISGGIGLILSLVGYHVTTGMMRFTFGITGLHMGIGIVSLGVGLFAIPEMIVLSAHGGTIAQAGAIVKGMKGIIRGAKDVFAHWTLWLRSSIIGYIVGIIPGIGGVVAMFIAYGQAKQSSKYPEKFGTGIVEGVIAPEAANNAKEAGALLTTLALGIPGSGVMAIFLAAFLILGLIPGPQMMTEHLDLSISLLLVVVAANVLGTSICMLGAPYLAKIAFTPSRVLVPLVWAIALIGAFAYRELFSDVIFALIFGLVGLAMKEFDYNRAALFLGFCLGSFFEKYLFISLDVAGPLFFVRPISLTLIFIMIGASTFRPVKRMLERRFKRG